MYVARVSAYTDLWQHQYSSVNFSKLLFKLKGRFWKFSISSQTAQTMTSISKTTFGGCTFDDILRGTKSYACDYMADITISDTVNKAQDILIQHVHNILDSIQIATDRTVDKYYIGKTFVTRRRKRSGHGFMTFKHMDSNTWRKNGISSRWTTHKKEDYGRDGMVVLATVPKAAIPKHIKSVHQEQYTLALEQKLLHHFLLTEADPRITNNTFGTGSIGKKASVAYALYLAFRLSDDTEDSINDSHKDNSTGNTTTNIPDSMNTPRTVNIPNTPNVINISSTLNTPAVSTNIPPNITRRMAIPDTTSTPNTTNMPNTTNIDATMGIYVSNTPDIINISDTPDTANVTNISNKTNITNTTNMSNLTNAFDTTDSSDDGREIIIIM